MTTQTETGSEQDLETPSLKDTEHPELPKGWEWRSASSSRDYYTRWFGTSFHMGGKHAGDGNRLGGFDGEVYWDRGGNGKHHVHIYPIIGMREDGDPEVSEYPDISRSFETVEEAIQAIPDLIDEL